MNLAKHLKYLEHYMYKFYKKIKFLRLDLSIFAKL